MDKIFILHVIGEICISVMFGGLHVNFKRPHVFNSADIIRMQIMSMLNARMNDLSNGKANPRDIKLTIKLRG